MNLLEQEDFSEESILNIIKSNLEESINIEFKSAKALSKENSVKKEISKDVSAFANSDGGIIFYGIDELNHIATSISYIDGNIFTKEWLENVIISSIQPKIDDLRIIPIRFENKISQTVYIVKIPSSNFSPHINGDKKYYRRFNFQSVPMEEYEIRNLYFKSRESDIYFANYSIRPSDEKDESFYNFIFEIQVANDGRHITDKYKVACNFSNVIGVRLSYGRDKKYNFTDKGKDGLKISNNEVIPLFPDEILNVLTFTLSIPKEDFENILEQIKTKVLIFGVSNNTEDELDISELLREIKETL